MSRERDKVFKEKADKYNMFEILHQRSDLSKLLTRFRGYLVGGYVRDTLLHKVPKDIDICSTLHPNKIEQLLQKFNYSFKHHGKSYGVYAITLPDGLQLELSAARVDFNQDGRHSEVSFVSNIEEDLARRDLTINAMALSRTHGLIDPFGGTSDLDNRIIKFVKDPAERIKEDNLRAWRAVRFAYKLFKVNCYEFSLEEKTKTAILDYCKGIVTRSKPLVLSPERMRMELELSLANFRHNYDLFLLLCNLLETAGLPVLTMRGCKQPPQFHEFDVFDHTYNAVICAPHILELQLALLLHDMGKVEVKDFNVENNIRGFRGHEEASFELAQAWLHKMTFSSETCNVVCELVSNHMLTIGATNKSKMKIMRKFKDREAFKLMYLFRLCDRFGKGNILTEESLVEETNKFRGCLTYEQKQPVKLAIGGLEVMEKFGLKPGPEVGAKLKLAQDLVFEDPANNTAEFLLKAIE